MVKLTVVSTDNLNYESESLTFKYNDTTMFRISNHSLNRGGKGLELLDSKHNVVASCGRWSKGFYKKVVKELFNLGFETAEKEIEQAIEDRRKYNIESHDSLIFSELRMYKSQLKELEATKIKLHNKIKTAKQKLINKSNCSLN